MLNERLIKIINAKMPPRKPFAELERLTGLDSQTWRHTHSGRYKPSAIQLEAICNLFPEYTLWLMTGKISPEAGQTSPELEQLEALKKAVGES